MGRGDGEDGRRGDDLFQYGGEGRGVRDVGEVDVAAVVFDGGEDGPVLVGADAFLQTGGDAMGDDRGVERLAFGDRPVGGRLLLVGAGGLLVVEVLVEVNVAGRREVVDGRGDDLLAELGNGWHVNIAVGCQPGIDRRSTRVEVGMGWRGELWPVLLRVRRSVVRARIRRWTAVGARSPGMVPLETAITLWFVVGVGSRELPHGHGRVDGLRSLDLMDVSISVDLGEQQPRNLPCLHSPLTEMRIRSPSSQS